MRIDAICEARAKPSLYIVLNIQQAQVPQHLWTLDKPSLKSSRSLYAFRREIGILPQPTPTRVGPASQFLGWGITESPRSHVLNPRPF